MLELPVVFVCENNGYGEYTPMEAVTAGAIIAARGRDGAARRPQVDGMDVWAVARRGRGGGRRASAPAAGRSFVEARTYRFVGHSRSDPGKYRPRRRARRAGASATRSSSPQPRLRDESALGGRRARGGRARRRRASSTQIEQAALAAPFPEPVELPEFKRRATA